MKRRFLSVLLALVLVLSFSLVTAVPVAAATPELELGIGEPDAIAEWSTAEVDVGTYSVHLEAGTGVDGNEGRVVIDAASVGITTLSDITSIAWSVYTVAGMPPHVDIYLDVDGDEIVDLEDVLTAEMSYNNPFYAHEEGPGVGPALWFDGDHVNDSWGAWFQTFEATEGDGFGTVNDDTFLWVTKMGSGYDDAPSGTLAQWIAGVVTTDPESEMTTPIISATTPVLRLEIEVDRWVYNSEAYIDDLTINSVTYDVEWTHVSPILVDDDKAEYAAAPFHSIQDAIDASIAGDTISVAAGTYDEQLEINNIGHSRTNLTLIGDMGDTTAGPGANAPTLQPQAAKDLVNGDVHIYSDGVDIKGFILDFNYTGTREGYGILVQAANVEIRDNEFQLGLGVTSHSDESGYGIDTAIGTDPGALVIDRNTFIGATAGDPADIGSLGIHMNPGGTSATKTVSNNVFSGDLYGAVAFHSGKVNVTDNVMTGKAADPSLGTFGVHIGSEATSALTNITVSGNDISQFGTGIDVFSNNLGTLTVTINNNVVQDNREGVYAGTEAVLTVNYNALSSNVDGVLLGGTGTADAKYNWWGDVAGPTIGTNPYDGPTAGDSVSANVDYLPWMIHTSLVSGWNIYSTPIAPGAASNTVEKALDLWGSGTDNFTIGWYFNGATQDWVQVVSATALQPMQAVYLKMTAAATIDVVLSAEYTSPPQVVMGAGWNLVGPAQMYTANVTASLNSAYFGTGAPDLWGYSQAYSPALHQTLWTFQRGDTYVDEDFIPTEGYWVHMVNPGLLAGFTSTPITEVP